jgi:hypothetical protein
MTENFCETIDGRFTMFEPYSARAAKAMHGRSSGDNCFSLSKYLQKRDLEKVVHWAKALDSSLDRID